MNTRYALLAAATAASLLAGCRSEGDIVVDENVGISALRSVCPAVGIPDHTGDLTLFFPEEATTADAIDVTAVITNVRSDCSESGNEVFSNVRFEVRGLRRDTNGARVIELPYFSTVVRGGSSVISKRLGSVTLNFADGQARASALGTAGAVVDRAEATLPPDIRQMITKPRRSGDADAAIDPLTRPEVRAAMTRANFELLVGFQLTEEQLAYNVTR
jgi:hypothetical protein